MRSLIPNILVPLLLLLSLPTIFAALQYKGADISSLLMLEAQGERYSSTSGIVTPLETILKNNGVNSVRQRLFVNPSGGHYNLDYNIRLARRVKAAGMGVHLNMHLSDTWADPAHQTTPAIWRDFTIPDLAWALYNYTLSVSNTFSDAGIPLEIISIGNEIRAGFLWPLGSTSNYYNIARLLHSASAGIRDSRLNPKPKILIQLDNGWDASAQRYFYDTVLAQGPLVSADFDLIGVSFYPFYTTKATLASLRSSLDQMWTRYGKPVLVVETGWPATNCPQVQFPSDLRSIPHTVDGQTTFFRQVAAVVDAVAGGVGLYYWEPGWVGFENVCGDNSLVDENWRARDSLKVFSSI